MSDATLPDDVERSNERSLNTLLRAIQLSQGQFALILARCNYTSLRDRIVQQLQERASVPIQVITLPEHTKTLFTTVQREVEIRGQGLGVRGQGLELTQNLELKTQNLQQSPTTYHLPPTTYSLLILGFESLVALDQVLTSANQVREEFRKHFQFPVVLWVNDRVLQKLTQLAPDFKAWATISIQFDLAIADLVFSLRDHTNRLFASILDAGDEQFPPNWAIAPPPNSLRRTELEFALNRILTSGYSIDSTLKASLDFLLGQEAHAQAELETARECYEKSLRFWESGVRGHDAEIRTRDTETASIQNSNPTSQNSPIPHSPFPIPYTERAACVLIYLGLWWRSYAVLQRATYEASCRNARTYFQRGLGLFEQINRQDLVAKFIIAEAEVLQKLGQWDDLEILVKKALILHQLYKDRVRQARDYGFLAEVAIARSNWAEAKQQVETARQILEETGHSAAVHDQLYPHLETSLDIAHRFHNGWYLLLLAKAEAHLGKMAAAIAHLEDARDHTYPKTDPPLYIQILQALWECYFQQGRYREAFHTKQARRSLEHQYGFRAFVGALRLEPQQFLIGSMAEQFDTDDLLVQEITASGRQQDVDRLIGRLGRNDYKLTVIHGPSGVGKSSIVNAGLVPALKERVIGDRIALPILVNVYTDWEAILQNALLNLAGSQEPGDVGADLTGDISSSNTQPQDFDTDSRASNTQSPVSDTQPRASSTQPQASDFQTQNPKSSPDTRPPTPSTLPFSLTPLLTALTTQNFLPVLIFDQFEEFFFVYETVPERRSFYEFLRDCLNLDYVKVILTLREDYIHYLLEFQKFARTDGINLDSINDILSKDIRYPLGDFSPAEAKAVIESLTTRAQFYLDDDLVEEMVHDLAKETGEVRPIELQVVGAEMQREGINTLAEYRQKGPKERLVQLSLEDVVADCGRENEAVARIVLFMLTNENGTRPLKTRDDLEADLVDLGMTHDLDKLDLVLEVLVGSGLVFLVPENPNDRYQIVHDYLVSFIQQQYKTGLVEELEHEQEQRKLAEEKLSVELQQRLRAEEKLNRNLKRQLFLVVLGGGILAITTLLAISFWSRTGTDKVNAS
jgi:tetratricopeptide (TPR) repeat protein